jgi:hypothetical protein
VRDLYTPPSAMRHRDEADLETNETTGFQQGTEIAVDRLAEHVLART